MSFPRPKVYVFDKSHSFFFKKKLLVYEITTTYLAQYDSQLPLDG